MITVGYQATKILQLLLGSGLDNIHSFTSASPSTINKSEMSDLLPQNKQDHTKEQKTFSNKLSFCSNHATFVPCFFSDFPPQASKSKFLSYYMVPRILHQCDWEIIKHVPQWI